MRKRARRVTKEMFEDAKRLINLNDRNGGNYTRRELGAKVNDGPLSDATMSRISVAANYEEYIAANEEHNRKYHDRNKAKKVTGQVEMSEDIARVYAQTVNENPDALGLIGAGDQVIVSLRKIREEIRRLGVALELILNTTAHMDD